MRLRVIPQRRLVTGTSRVRFAPDLRTDRVVLRLWANGPHQIGEGARLRVHDVRVNGNGARVSHPDPTTMTVATGRLGAGEQVMISFRWRLRVPGPTLDRISARGTSIRLGSFFPLLAWEPGRGWATEPPTSLLGETSSSPTADFQVRVEAPDGLSVLATGRRERGVWRAVGVRDFALAVGRFKIARAVVSAPQPVSVTVGVSRGLLASPGDFLQAVERALSDLSRRYGAYPWDTLSLAVMPDLRDAGIEYPAMIFQGPDSLQRATTHEVAHSWFYGLVGNNQARDPWLDEALASWAQARGDRILHWFRSVHVPASVRGHLGAPMRFWGKHGEAYFEGVYAQGVQTLASLGAPRLVDCALRRYVASNAYAVARPADLRRAFARILPRSAARLRRAGALGAGRG